MISTTSDIALAGFSGAGVSGVASLGGACVVSVIDRPVGVARGPAFSLGAVATRPRRCEQGPCRVRGHRPRNGRVDLGDARAEPRGIGASLGRNVMTRMAIGAAAALALAMTLAGAAAAQP